MKPAVPVMKTFCMGDEWRMRRGLTSRGFHTPGPLWDIYEKLNELERDDSTRNHILSF